jgi:NSS family neurotransmitter:Na+ symporter
MAAYHAGFLLVTAVVVGRGVVDGIERASRILMPALIILLVLLSGYAMIEGDVAAAVRFLLALDTDHMTAKVALEALGLGFFSIGVGYGTMITYAAYAGRDIDLRQVAIVTVVGDTAISFLAGFAVFPIVFADALDPASGPGLMFVTLPLAFSRMPFGAVAAAAFFLLLAVAALASAISMLEMPVAFLHRRLAWRRSVAAGVCAFGCWLIGIATVLSFNRWAGWFPLAFLPGFATATVFDVIDHLTSNLLLPICGLALAVFGGWVVPAALLGGELGLAPAMTRVLRFLLRWVALPGIIAAAMAPLLLRT